jgi:hypothetical protein
MPSGTEEIVHYNGKAYLIWKKGDKEGIIFDAINKPTFLMPQRKDILEMIDRQLKRIDELSKEDPVAAEKLAIQLLISLHRLYHGGKDFTGLKIAQYFDSDILELVSEMEKEYGLKQWLKEYATKRGYLNVHISSGASSWDETQAIYQYYYGHLQSKENLYQGPEKIIYRHGTYGNIIPDVLNLGGLASPDYFKARGLIKKTGESGRGGSGYTGHAVSFSYLANKPAQIGGGWGSQQAFEYPIAFAIDDSKAKEIDTYDGTMSGEKLVGAKPVVISTFQSAGLEQSVTDQLVSFLFKKQWLWSREESDVPTVASVSPYVDIDTIRKGIISEFPDLKQQVVEKVINILKQSKGGFVPLNAITHLFVPYFVVDEVRRLFHDHGYENIKIMPLGFNQSGSIEDGPELESLLSLLDTLSGKERVTVETVPISLVKEVVTEAVNPHASSVILPNRSAQPLRQIHADMAMNSPGGIDLNSANLNFQIKRDGKGVPLPIDQQDLSKLRQIAGFVPVLIEIKPAAGLPIFSSLQKTLQLSS